MDLGSISLPRDAQSLAQAARGGAGVATPGGGQESCGRGTGGRGLVATGMVGVDDLGGLCQP